MSEILGGEFHHHRIVKLLHLSLGVPVSTFSLNSWTLHRQFLDFGCCLSYISIRNSGKGSVASTARYHNRQDGQQRGLDHPRRHTQRHLRRVARVRLVVVSRIFLARRGFLFFVHCSIFYFEQERLT
jgi:hypothetical protein